MPSVSDLLARFRPAGTPGPAAPAGVPEDRRAAAERELAPVFAALAGVERECAKRRADARTDASRRTAGADRRAAAIVAEAQARAPAERSRVAASRQAHARHELAALLDEARAQARTVRDEAARRLPDRVAAVVARVRADLR